MQAAGQGSQTESCTDILNIYPDMTVPNVPVENNGVVKLY